MWPSGVDTAAGDSDDEACGEDASFADVLELPACARDFISFAIRTCIEAMSAALGLGAALLMLVFV